MPISLFKSIEATFTIHFERERIAVKYTQTLPFDDLRKLESKKPPFAFAAVRSTDFSNIFT